MRQNLSMRNVNRLIGIYAIGLCICASAWAADIYRFDTSNGTVRFASQSLDASYWLYLKGEPEPAIPSTPAGYFRTRQSARFESLIELIAQKYKVETALVRAIIAVESNFDAQALSPKGAAGLMQLMPSTAARYGVTDPYDALQNIEAGVRYLKELLALHQGSVALALASYNAGERAVVKHKRRIPPYKETMLYVPAVLVRLQAYRNTSTP